MIPLSPKSRNFKDVGGALPFLCNVNIIISTVDSCRVDSFIFLRFPPSGMEEGSTELVLGLSAAACRPFVANGFSRNFLGTACYASFPPQLTAPSSARLFL